jgi:hypothetical protein
MWRRRERANVERRAQPHCPIEQQLRDVAADVEGAPDNWRMAATLEYAAYHGPIEACMTAHGQVYRYPPVIDPMAGRTDALIPDTFTAIAELPTERGLVPNVADTITAGYADAQAYAATEPDLANVPSAAYIAALDACGATDGTTAMPEWPVADADLEAAFQALMRAAQESPDVAAATAGWAPCMATKGYDLAEETDLYQLVTTYYAAFAVDPDDPAATREPTGPEWDAAVAKEAAAAAADLECRTPAHNAAMLALDGKIAAFRTEHAAQLADAAAFWADLAARGTAG